MVAGHCADDDTGHEVDEQVHRVDEQAAHDLHLRAPVAVHGERLRRVVPGALFDQVAHANEVGRLDDVTGAA